MLDDISKYSTNYEKFEDLQKETATLQLLHLKYGHLTSSTRTLHHRSKRQIGFLLKLKTFNPDHLNQIYAAQQEERHVFNEGLQKSINSHLPWEAALLFFFCCCLITWYYLRFRHRHQNRQPPLALPAPSQNWHPGFPMPTSPSAETLNLETFGSELPDLRQTENSERPVPQLSI